MKNAYNQGLRYETYYFINKQLEKETVWYLFKTLLRNNLIITQKIIQEYLW
jgi:hypothetical protein